METKTDVGFLLAGTPSYKDLQNVYLKWFSLGGIAGEIDNKFALISLIIVQSSTVTSILWNTVCTKPTALSIELQ